VITACGLAGQVFAGEKIDKTLAAKGVTSITIENQSGEVTILGWDKNEVSVQGDLDDRAEQFIFERNGSHIEMSVEMPNSNHWGSSGSELTIHIPENIHVNFDGISTDVNIENLTGSTEVKTISGKIKAKNLQKHVELSSISGDVISENLSGDISLATISGGIEDEGSSGELQLQAVSGDISSKSSATEVSISNVSGETEVSLAEVDELKLSTVSSDAEIELFLNDNGSVKFSSVSGDLDVKFQKGVQARFKLKASAGGDLVNKITADKAEQAKYGPSEKLKFQTGNGSASVKANTVSGKIKLSIK